MIAADGAQSFVRQIIDDDLRKNRANKGLFGNLFKRKSPIQAHIYEDKNIRVYRTVPIRFTETYTQTVNNNVEVKKRRKDLNYSSRTKSDINLDALPTKEGLYLGVVLYRPWDKRVTSLNSTSEARDFFNKIFPMFSPYIKDSDLEEFVQKSDSKFPRFSYVGPQLHKGSTTCLLGTIQCKSMDK